MQVKKNPSRLNPKIDDPEPPIQIKNPTNTQNQHILWNEETAVPKKSKKKRKRNKKNPRFTSYIYDPSLRFERKKP